MVLTIEEGGGVILGSPMMLGQKRKTFSDFKVDFDGSGIPPAAEPLTA